MWTRFTERARRVVVFAQEEAMRRGMSEVSTEHLLLGMVRDDGMASVILNRLEVSPEKVRQEVLQKIGNGAEQGEIGGEMSLSAETKRVVDQAYAEARLLKGNYIGQEHLLLGLMGQTNTVAYRILKQLGVEYQKALNVVLTLNEGEKASGVVGAARYFDKRTLHILAVAERERKRQQQEQLTPELLTTALIQEGREMVIRLLEATRKPTD